MFVSAITTGIDDSVKDIFANGLAGNGIKTGGNAVLPTELGIFRQIIRGKVKRHRLGWSLPEQPPPRIYRDQRRFVGTT
jgi:hypothetical protein